MAGSQDADDVGAQVVPGPFVLRARIAEPDGQQVGGLARAFALQVP
jgi:hypothetical protein